MTKPTLYLDVDGVLLGHPEPRSGPYQLANHAVEFLGFVLTHFETAWATTHCRTGDARHLLSYLAEHTPGDLREEIQALAQRVRPTRFQTLKTDIFLASSNPSWIWIDDAPLQAERQVLARNGWEDRWLRVDTSRVPDDLLRAQRELMAAIRHR